MELAEILKAVREVDLFQDFSDLEELVAQCPQVSLADREVFLEHGTVGSSMYVILDGRVEIYLNDRIIRVIGQGEYLGELALIESGTRSASARALGAATLLEIPHEQFERYVRARPEAVLAVARKISRRLRDSIVRTQAAYEHVNNDRDFGQTEVAANALQDLEAVHLGHHHVENDQGRLQAREQRVERLLAVLGGDGPVPARLHHHRVGGAQVGLIVDDEDRLLVP
jgi:CRP-like cAMP-binding protein